MGRTWQDNGKAALLIFHASINKMIPAIPTYHHHQINETRRRRHYGMDKVDRNCMFVSLKPAAGIMRPDESLSPLAELVEVWAETANCVSLKDS